MRSLFFDHLNTSSDRNRKKMNYKLDVELSPELEAYRDKIAATIKPNIEIQLTDNDKPTWWQSKFGGLPYLPQGFEYPKSWNDEYLYLLAQINFAEVPHLEGFPDKGILQFYIHDGEKDDIIWGLDLSNPNNQDYFRVLYFPDVDSNEDSLITNFSFLKQSESYGFPIDGCCSLEFEYGFEPVTIEDYQFDLFNIYEDENKSIYQEYWDKFCRDKHKLGGYANFTQEDPRFYCNKEEPYILLLQIVSDSFDVYTYRDRKKAIDILWGDGGIGNFFIKKSALEKLNFSDVLYNWDCR